MSGRAERAQVALGLYSMRDAYAADFPDCLRQVARMGYRGVECFGAPQLPPRRVRASLEDAALVLTGWHVPIELLNGEAFAPTVRYLHAVGVTEATVPFMPPETFASRGAVLAFAERMRAIDLRLRPEGIRLGYHNHEAEFARLPDGALPWAVLMEHTDILTQLDTGNALAGGLCARDLPGMITRWPGRSRTIHLKPYAKRGGFDAMIGQDDTDWPRLLAATGDAGVRWLIIEYEEDARASQTEGAQRCLRALEAFLP